MRRRAESPDDAASASAASTAATQGSRASTRSNLTSAKKERRDKDTPKRFVNRQGSLEDGNVTVGGEAKLKATARSRQVALFHRKLAACARVYDFTTETKLREKEVKTQTLTELVEFVGMPNTGGMKDFKSSFNEALMRDYIDMVAANIFRTLTTVERTPLDVLSDPENEDSPFLDAAWPHLEYVYELLVRFVVCKEVDLTLAQKFITVSFALKLFELLLSDDSRERGYVKSVVIKIFHRFEKLRATIRHAIQNGLTLAAYEAAHVNGVAELLELASELSSEFTKPLVTDPKNILLRVLLPLHKLETFRDFQPQIVRCMKQYVERDARLSFDILTCMLRIWPVSPASKQVLFLDELEELLALMPQLQFRRLREAIIHRIALCIASPHYQVAERVLNLWSNDSIVKLINQNSRAIYPVIAGPLSSEHWHNQVQTKRAAVVKQLKDKDPGSFAEGLGKRSALAKAEEAKCAQREARERMWDALRELQSRRGGASGDAANTGFSRQTSRSSSSSAAVRSKQRRKIGLDELVEMAHAKYGLAVSWGPAAGGATRLELQVLLVDRDGEVVDAVHGRNVTTARAAVKRVAAELGRDGGGGGGDAQHRHTSVPFGREVGYSDVIWLTLARLPPEVELIICFLVPLGTGNMKDISHKTIHVFEDLGLPDTCVLDVDTGASNVAAVLSLGRSGETEWSLTRLEKFPKRGRHFMDVLEPTVGDIIRHAFPTLPHCQRTRMKLEAGSIVDLPQHSTARWVYAGLCWDLACSTAIEDFELEVSALVFDKTCQHLGGVRPDNEEEFGIRHCGSTFLNGGVIVDLDAVPQEVAQILLTGHVVTKHLTFEGVQRPRCHVIDPTGTILLRCLLGEAAAMPGLVVARLVREAGRKRWFFQAMGVYTGGHRWNASMEETASLVKRPASEFQLPYREDTWSTTAESARVIISL